MSHRHPITVLPRTLLAPVFVALFALVQLVACSDDATGKQDAMVQRDMGPADMVPVDAVADTSREGTSSTDLPSQADSEVPRPDFPQTPSGMLAALRAAPDGAVDIPISDLFVTYVKEALGDDVAGFFVQAEKAGPAVFVALAPASLDPLPKVGDSVSFTVKAVATNQKRREITAIETWKVATRDNTIDGLVQDLSGAADIATALDSYAAELITLQGAVAEDFGNGGTGFVVADITTVGIPTAGGVRLRLPEALQQSLKLTKGCTFRVHKTPLWRFNNNPQPSAWVAADIEVLGCDAPEVVSAVALSPTSIRVTFDHALDAGSVKADGSQFTFDDTALVASAAVVDDKQVEVTTGPQTAGKAYVVTVAATVKDQSGKALKVSANTAPFQGFASAAKVLINEFNTNIKDGCDLVELRVIEDGSLQGMVLSYRTSPLITLPHVLVKKNDFVIIHLDADDNKCYATRPADETKAKNEVVTSDNYDSAWDLYTEKGDVATTDGVLTLRDAPGQIVDAVFYIDPTRTRVAGSSLAAADAASAANQWSPEGGSAPTNYDLATFKAAALTSPKNNGTARSGKTFSRATDVDTHTKADWTDGQDSSWGTANPGQSVLP